MVQGRGDVEYDGQREDGDEREDHDDEGQEFVVQKKKKDEFSYTPFEDWRDPNGEKFDPSKKFGIIEDNSLIYDNVTTSYPLNLPTDFYMGYIQNNMPKESGGNGKWFIRPHHLETLTQHPLSIKDDVLNTRYYSHYNQSYGVKEEKDHKQDAIDKLEEHL